MIAEVQNILVPTHNFQESVFFYRDLLDLPILAESDEFCFLDAGGVNIAIHPVGQESDFVPGGNGIYLDVLVPQLESYEARLKSADVIIRKRWQDDLRRYILVADPDGNLVEICEPK